MPLDNAAVMGTEADGQLNPDYCNHCFSDGVFVNPHITLDEMKERVETEMRKRDMDQHLINLTVNSLPYFRRWQHHDVVM
jgi:hypothetical protein